MVRRPIAGLSPATIRHAVWEALCVGTLLLNGAAASHAAAQTPEEWVVHPEPTLRLGWSADQPDTEFFNVVSAARLPDGSIAVADRGLSKVLVIGHDGLPSLILGGAGEGPGEFTNLAQVLVGPAGHIYAFDARQQRLTEWDQLGGLVGTTTLSRAAAGRRMSAVGVLPDGRWFAREAPRMTATTPGEVARDVVGVYELSKDGIIGDRIIAVPGVLSTLFEFRGQSGIRAAMFSPRALLTQLGGCLLSMGGDGQSIGVTTLDRAVDRTIPLNVEARTTQESDRQAWVQGTIEATNAPASSVPILEGVAAELAMADQFPVANRIEADPGGYVWLERYVAPEGPSGNWLAVDGTGTVVAEISLPPRLRLLGIGSDHVIGVFGDELDRQEIRVHSLTRERVSRDGPLAACEPGP